MTSQIADQVVFEDEQYALTAVDGTGLFHPVEHGYEPRFLSTGCYRGFVCTYAVVADRLLLRDLELGSEDEPAPFDGVRPQLVEYQGWQYDGLNRPVAFTGRLLVGTGRPDYSPRLNMGFCPAWLCEQVRELVFRDGQLLTATDCSAALAAVRAEIADFATEPPAGEDVGDWIDRTFSLTYDYSWPGRQRSPDSAHDHRQGVQ
jgi:hypothetical protein